MLLKKRIINGNYINILACQKINFGMKLFDIQVEIIITYSLSLNLRANSRIDRDYCNKLL